MLINIDSECNHPREFARKSYTLKHKRTTVRVVEGFLSTGVKINEACSLACVEKRVFYRWNKNIMRIEELCGQYNSGSGC